MQVLFGKEYWRQCNPGQSALARTDIERCEAAVAKFRRDPRNPGLNFERLGSGARQNHWSIRASQELRVILAVEWASAVQEPGQDPVRLAPVNMGHHDAMYDWSERRRFYTDLDDSGLIYGHDSQSDLEAEDQSRPPIELEEWMLFPAREQHILTAGHFAGATRVRGAAGTGKTVVALHRAAVLGRRYADERVLVTTFSRSLCNHMRSLFGQMPDSPENVDFVNIDALPSKLLGPPGLVDFDAADMAFDRAYRLAVPSEDAERLPPDYMKEEIERVIKGRSASRDEYLDTDRFQRLGRIRSFRKRDREICWNLANAWDQAIKARGLTSFPDRLIEARDRAWEATTPPYRAAIVDEGQDMTLVGMQLVRALVAGHPDNELKVDSLMVLDDAAQRIYPGGYLPKWANLDFRGSSRSLRLNYRNHRRVFEAARAVRGDAIIAREANDDGAVDEVEFERGSGEAPILRKTARNREAPAIVERIRLLVNQHGYGHDEIGVLTRRNSNVDTLMRYLRNRQIPCVNLKVLRNGPLESGVRVGTFDRAKGMEFRAVIVCRLGKSVFPLEPEERLPDRQLAMNLAPGEPTRMTGQPERITDQSGRITDEPGRMTSMPEQMTDEEREQRQLHLDRLYVAMTRARERLYLIADEDFCDEIANASREFQERRPTMQ